MYNVKQLETMLEIAKISDDQEIDGVVYDPETERVAMATWESGAPCSYIIDKNGEVEVSHNPERDHQVYRINAAGEVEDATNECDID